MNEAKETLFDLYAGIVLYVLIVCIIGAFVADNKCNFILGVVYGGFLSLFLAFHMYRSIDRTLDFDSSGAEKYAKRMAATRMVISAGVIGLAFFLSAFINIIGVIFGMMALKLSAYMQPFIHKFITAKIYHKGG